MTIKDAILALQTGEKYNITVGGYNIAEIWYINNEYFLFELTAKNTMKLAKHYHNIDKLMEKIESWT